MRNLFQFIYRYNAFFIFLLLEIVALILIIRNNGYQRAAYLNLSDEVTGRTFVIYKEVTGYLTLGEENKKLNEENARLHNMLPASSYSDSNTALAKTDSSKKIFYTYVPARVIQITSNQPNNYLIIDKGSNAGIEPRMAVLGPDGVVGIVKNVSKNFSILYSLLHSQVTVSARVHKDGSRGTIKWDGKSPDYVNLEEITRQEQLKKGDTVYTSGVSRIFPDLIPIGTVDEFKLMEPGNFYDIRIKLATNYRKIDHVYVVNNMLHAEMDSLIKKAENVQ
jgi:rod shape-determining protein MreC